MAQTTVFGNPLAYQVGQNTTNIATNAAAITSANEAITTLNSKFEDRVVDDIHYINGEFDTSQTSTPLSRVTDVLSQISTGNKDTIFDIIIVGAGRFNFNGYLYSQKSYGSGYLCAYDTVYRWVRNNGTDSLEQLATKEIISNFFTLDTTYVEGHEVTARETAGVVTLNGYVKLKSSAVIGVHSIGSISQGHRPASPVRIACGFAPQAYQAPTGMGYFVVGADGNVGVTAPSGNSSQFFYFTLAYVAQD